MNHWQSNHWQGNHWQGNHWLSALIDADYSADVYAIIVCIDQVLIRDVIMNDTLKLDVQCSHLREEVIIDKVLDLEVQSSHLREIIFINKVVDFSVER